MHLIMLLTKLLEWTTFNLQNESIRSYTGSFHMEFGFKSLYIIVSAEGKAPQNTSSAEKCAL